MVTIIGRETKRFLHMGVMAILIMDLAPLATTLRARIGGTVFSGFRHSFDIYFFRAPKKKKRGTRFWFVYKALTHSVEFDSFSCNI